MSAPIVKDVVATCGLTARDVELSLKALITMLEGNQKPDYDKLSKLAGMKDSQAASKAFWATRKKLQTVKMGSDDASADGNGNDDAAALTAVETPKRKRKGTDTTGTPASKTPKRGRGRPKKNAEPAAAAAENGDAEAGGQAGADSFDVEV